MCIYLMLLFVWRTRILLVDLLITNACENTWSIRVIINAFICVFFLFSFSVALFLSRFSDKQQHR